MLTCRRRLLACLVTVGALAVVGAPSGWAQGWWGGVDCAQIPAAGCDLSVGTATVNDGDATTGGGGGAGSPCQYLPASPGWTAIWVQTYGHLPDNHAVYLRMCDGSDVVLVALDQTAPPPTPASPEDLARAARAQLRLPAPRIATNPAGDQLVGLPTWLWVQSWEPVSATASLAGVSVTATATPREVRWSMGDGSTLTCVGPGTPYHAGGDPAAASPDCGYLYSRSSAGQPGAAFAVTATVRWSVTWSGAGTSGSVDDLTTSGTRRLRVAEVQAIVDARDQGQRGGHWPATRRTRASGCRMVQRGEHG